MSAPAGERPIKTLGVLGGGQLGRMMALAGIPLGLKFCFLDPSAQACAAALGKLVQADYADTEAVRRLADQIDVASYDFENIPAESARAMLERKPLYPGVKALQLCQDRLIEKNLLKELEIAVPAFEPVNSRMDLWAASEKLGFPCVVKTRRLGYDGKGQIILRQAEDLERAWQRLGDAELILEEFVPYQAECSVIAVRSQSGEVRFWPLTRNHHVDAVLTLSRPGNLPGHLQQQAEVVGQRLLEHFDYVGVMTVEFFIHNGALLVNEIAPRVHNSGHWTIDGAVTSQFENHVRAVAGMPLGDTRMMAHSVMFNWLGQLPDRQALLAIPGMHWHDYTKQARPGRKLGHATLTAADEASLLAGIEQTVTVLGEPWPKHVDNLLAELSV